MTKLLKTKLPLGFRAGGVNCGVRKNRPDLGIVISDTPALAVGVFTRNTFKGVHVLRDIQMLPSNNIRAIIVNSGEANAKTGAPGVQDNLELAKVTARKLGCKLNQVLTASTGVIGKRIQLSKITRAIPKLVKNITNDVVIFSSAIRSTDIVSKTSTIEVKLSEGVVRITGVSKGSGMIHPNMGTMLGFITTDAILNKHYAAKILRSAADQSFNMVSVDGETSPNDSVFLLANGASKVSLVTMRDKNIFQQALTNVATSLAMQIAADGEGASKLMEVTVLCAPTLKLARLAARSVTVSPLTKAAVNGADPNWGRILTRLGAEQISEKYLDRTSIIIQGVTVLKNGNPAKFNSDNLHKALLSKNVSIIIDFHSGKESATAWGCDLTYGYVKINREYS